MDTEPRLVEATSRLRLALDDARGRLRAADALVLAGFERPSFYKSRIVRRAMEQLGWDRTRLRFGGGELAYAYARGDMLEREVVLDLERTADGQIVVKRREP